MTGADLLRHVGHDVEIVTYGSNGSVWDVALECLTCGEVITDFDYSEIRPDLEVTTRTALTSETIHKPYPRS